MFGRSTLPFDTDHGDPLLKGLEKAAPYFDEGSRTGPIRPSTAMCLAYIMAVSSDDPEVVDRARSRARHWLAEGRKRYREGYYANPLTPEPRVRPTAKTEKA